MNRSERVLAGLMLCWIASALDLAQESLLELDPRVAQRMRLRSSEELQLAARALEQLAVSAKIDVEETARCGADLTIRAAGGLS